MRKFQLLTKREHYQENEKPIQEAEIVYLFILSKRLNLYAP